MKSALLAAIFWITGAVAILLAEDKGAAVKFRQAMAEEGLPPQREMEPYVIREPVEHISIWRYAAGAQFTQAKAKPEKQATQQPSAHHPIASKLLAEIGCQFHEAPKTSTGEIIL